MRCMDSECEGSQEADLHATRAGRQSLPEPWLRDIVRLRNQGDRHPAGRRLAIEPFPCDGGHELDETIQQPSVPVVVKHPRSSRVDVELGVKAERKAKRSLQGQSREEASLLAGLVRHGHGERRPTPGDLVAAPRRARWDRSLNPIPVPGPAARRILEPDPLAMKLVRANFDSHLFGPAYLQPQMHDRPTRAQVDQLSRANRVQEDQRRSIPVAKPVSKRYSVTTWPKLELQERLAALGTEETGNQPSRGSRLQVIAGDRGMVGAAVDIEGVPECPQGLEAYAEAALLHRVVPLRRHECQRHRDQVREADRLSIVGEQQLAPA